MEKWKDLIIAGVLVWVTAVQKDISYLTQLFFPVRVEEYGGETSHNVYVSFQCLLCWGLRLSFFPHSLKSTWLDHMLCLPFVFQFLLKLFENCQDPDKHFSLYLVQKFQASSLESEWCENCIHLALSTLRLLGEPNLINISVSQLKGLFLQVNFGASIKYNSENYFKLLSIIYFSYTTT